MLKGETILCISPTSWLSLWRNRQQIMSRLVQKNCVVFVEPQRTLAEPPAKRNKCFQEVCGNLEIIEPPAALPFGASVLPTAVLRLLSPAIVKINNSRLTSFLKKYIRTRQICNPILWLYDPLHVGLVGKLGEKLVVYHAHDDTSIFPFNFKIKQVIVQNRRRLLGRANVVFECSLTAYHLKKQSYCNIHYIPNGVDFQQFQKVLSPYTAIPADIGVIQRPIIGFYGGVDFRLDLDLLRFIARSRPQWSLVLVGTNTLNRSHKYLDLHLFNNIHLLGSRDYQVLPNYVKAFDVVIWPYIATESVSIASTPLKLYECLAAGKPIVTVKLPIESGRELVYMAQTPEEFVARIEEAIYDRDNADRIERGITLARRKHLGQAGGTDVSADRGSFVQPESNKMIDSHVEWVEQFYVCPSCHSSLERIERVGYRCVKEDLTFPVPFGIPDFRLLGSRDKAEDERVNALAEKFDNSDYQGLVRFYMDSFGNHRAFDLWKEGTERMVAALTVQTEKYEHMKIHFAQTGIELMGKGWALELGCGTGGMVCILAQKFDRVVGLDAAPDKLILAMKLAEQSHCINATFVCAYAEHLPFAHQTFSFVSAHDVIEHVGDQQHTLLEVRRSLQRGGCFYFTIPNRYSLVGPEPHVGVWGVGFLPRRWASYYVKLVKGVRYEGKRLPSYLELSHWLNICFGYDFCRVYVLPDGALPAASVLGQAYRMFLTLPLARHFVNIVGRLIWEGFGVVCRKN